MDLEKLNQAEIIVLLGGIYEHSPWVAEAIYSEGITSNDNNINSPCDNEFCVLNSYLFFNAMSVLIQLFMVFGGKIAVIFF